MSMSALTYERDLLTRNEAALLLGVQPQTLAVWASSGRYGLPIVKVGRSVRYSRAALLKWIASRTQGGVAS